MNWESVSIKQYKQINKVLDIEDEIEKAIEILGILDNKSIDYYYNIPYLDLIDELKRVSSLFSTMPKPIIASKIKIGEYDLRLTTKIDKMPAGQYFDYSNAISTQPDNYALLMAILYVPKGMNYADGYDPLELVKEFENRSICEALGVSNFFLAYFKALTEAFLKSSKRKLKKEMKKEKNLETKNLIARSLKEMDLFLLDLQNK